MTASQTHVDPAAALAAMQDYPPVKVLVLGSGTSAGIPVINCTCPVCTSDDPHNQRMRASIRVEVDGKTLLVDCGVDFRMQMLRFHTPRLDAVLVTHTHADHIHGIDDLRVFCFRQREHLPIYSSRPFLDDISTRFAYAFDPPQRGGGVPLLELREVKPGELFQAAGVPVLPIAVMHGRLRILGFRFGRFAYLTDCSHIPEESMALLDGVQWLIVSALRYRPHSTHFNIEQATEAARRIGARQTYFIHMCDAVDHAEAESKLPEGIGLTYDGLEFEAR